MWYKLYVRVGLDGMRLSSGNFAVMYFNSVAYDWIIDDHEIGEIFTRSDIVDIQERAVEHVIVNWCGNILRDAADLIMHEKGYDLTDYEQRWIELWR